MLLGETGPGPPIETFGGDAFETNYCYVLLHRQFAAGQFNGSTLAIFLFKMVQY
jgi:hypothetical protein